MTSNKRGRKEMIQEQMLSQVIDRLETLEHEVQAMKARFAPQPESLHFEFILSVNGQEVWRGLDLEKRCREILQDSPDAQITIDWDPSPITPLL
jgi:hypothetical protein